MSKNRRCAKTAEAVCVKGDNMIIASCGHTTKRYNVCWIMDSFNPDRPITRKITLCPRCYRKAKRNGFLIKDMNQHNDYLNKRLPIKKWSELIK